MQSNPSPYALGPDEGEALWFTEQLIIVKAAAEQTGNRFSLLEQSAPEGAATPFHVHPEDDETFYVLDGALTFYLEDGSPIPASAGSFVHVPGGTGHAYRVDSETALMLILTTPQHERFIRAAANPAQARTLPPHAPPDMERIAAAAREHGVEILGPPPGARAEEG